MLYNAIVPVADPNDVEVISDADDKDLIAAYAIEALNWGVENDVIWVTNDLVRPTENALRWEVAAAIYAFCEYVAK